MIFIKCQDGRYINAETIQVFYVEDNYDSALIGDQCIIAKSSSAEYTLGSYLIKQTDNVLEQLIAHLATNRNYDMPEPNEEDDHGCVLTTV